MKTELLTFPIHLHQPSYYQQQQPKHHVLPDHPYVVWRQLVPLHVLLRSTLLRHAAADLLALPATQFSNQSVDKCVKISFNL